MSSAPSHEEAERKEKEPETSSPSLGIDFACIQLVPYSAPKSVVS
ncbi:hypothetical protein GcM1_185018 [Golovinomyces cichoracearum]|uniref:Uncharacterized protein n=1 Tax=Golovinomyces cichoracearum TaxID=62708 RepID=A0A420J360_9PEZI|nr:hypothetical protein GcM1_185018 [Golovinomyces cichoracearum]